MKIGNFSQNMYLQGIRNNNTTSKVAGLRADTVSFKGVQNKMTSVGTDVVLDLVRKCADLLAQGEKKLVTDAVSLMQSGKINEAIAEINKNAPANGVIESVEEGTKILARNWDGSPVEHIFKKVKGFKNLGLVKKVDDAGRVDLLKKAFGTEPKATVGMVGWTNIKPENVAGGTALSKAELTKLYEEGIEEFYSPIQRYFESIGVKPKDTALVSSVSYSGVDKAIMDLGEKKGIGTLTVTPFDYSIYGRAEHPFPTIITDTIPQYVDVYGKMSDCIVVTGGRDHAFKFDAGGKWLRQNKGTVIPVDILKDFKGITIPALKDGKIENAAALAYETFADPMPKGLVEGFKKLPTSAEKEALVHPAQKALATAIWNNLLKNGAKV